MENASSCGMAPHRIRNRSMGSWARRSPCPMSYSSHRGSCRVPGARGLGPGILPTQGVLALLTGLCLTRWFPGATRTALGGPGILLSWFRILYGFPALFLNPPCSEYVWLGTKPGTHRLSMEGAPGSFEARSSAFQCVLGLDPRVPCGRDPVGTASRIFFAFGTLIFESGSIPRQR